MERVQHAMSTRDVVPATFERCACAFLRALYQRLSPVEGGHDHGRDADIYPEDPASTKIGRVLVTTGDPVANLRNGLKRMAEEGLSIGYVVIACIRPLSATKRATLEEICSDNGLPLPHIYAQDWFLERLVADPAWREELLGIRGQLSALLDRPLEMLESAVAPPTLVGRETELATVFGAVDAGEDVVLAGVPGVGKTRLLVDLDKDVVFLERAAGGVLVDQLVGRNPAVVAVDDAQFRVDDLRALRVAREQEGLDFSIVATTWPDAYDEVARELPAARLVPVERLERETLNALVESVGVTGHWARAAVLRQADGRPGWALTLCELLTKGAGSEVVTGTAQLDTVERLLRRGTESETALDVVACLAALGHADHETLHALAPIIGIPGVKVVAHVEQAARGGLVDKDAKGFQLLPALRGPLVARWFFSDRLYRPWLTLTTAFPDRATAFARSAIEAARTGAVSARSVIEEWAQSLPEPTAWTAETIEAVSEYSTIDSAAARVVVAHARTMLAEPREVERFGGVRIDWRGDAAARLLARAAQMWLIPEAIEALLELATDDVFPRSDRADDPVRVLVDLARRLDPDQGVEIETRTRVLDVLLRWLRTAPNPARWVVAAEVIRAVFSVEVSASWSEPGAPNTITLAQGLVPASVVELLISRWDAVVTALQPDSEVHILGCPAVALAHLVDLAGDWVRVAAGFFPPGCDAPAGYTVLVASGAASIVESLRAHVQPVPGLAFRLQSKIDLAYFDRDRPAEMATGFDLDADLRDLLDDVDLDLRDDTEAVLADRAASLEALAVRLVGLGAEAGTARLRELLGHAELLSSPPTAVGSPTAWART